jgi:hypothetical protein
VRSDYICVAPEEQAEHKAEEEEYPAEDDENEAKPVKAKVAGLKGDDERKALYRSYSHPGLADPSHSSLCCTDR